MRLVVNLLIRFYYVVYIEFFVGHLLVELRNFLESKMLYKVEKRLFLYFNLLVLEPSFEHFLCIYAFFHLRFLQCKAYFRLRTSRFCYVQPFLFRLLRNRRRYLHGVAAVQFGSYRGILAVYLSTNALVSNL